MRPIATLLEEVKLTNQSDKISSFLRQHQTIGEILILTGRALAVPCGATSIQMGAKVLILVTRYGAVMNAVT